ncbi:NfeD family protein [Synechococcus sp. H55.7]|uniref:NfeD family protein n=1 Tax=unclassified Synechococcus TaxID=2626047 RepID=UPI0039C1C817
MVWPWIVFGLVLIASELFLPELVAGPVGVAALGAALLAYWGWPIWAQFSAWILLSIGLIVLSRRLVPSGSTQLEDLLKESREARAVTAIPPGQRGRVSYLGSTWNAKCSIPNLEIQAGQELYVVERQGNTLIVMPAKMLKS